MENHPDIPDKILLLSAVNMGFGNLAECKKMIDDFGYDFINELIRIENISREAI